MAKGCPALKASVCARWTVRVATRCSSHLLVYSSVSAQGLHIVCTGRHSHPQGYLAGRTGSWSLTGSRSPLCSLGPNSVLTLRVMAPPGCFPLSVSFVFKQRWRDSKLHSFSVSSHSFNLFKRTADIGPEASFAYSNFRDKSFWGLSHRSLNEFDFLSCHSHWKWELWNYVDLIRFCSSAPKHYSFIFLFFLL